jgi:phage terminase large subunit-like protein
MESQIRWLVSLSESERNQVLSELNEGERRVIASYLYDWHRPVDLGGARENQKPPEGEYFIWLLQAGRGFGKTRSAAEYVRIMIDTRQWRTVNVAAPTWTDVLDTMVYGNEEAPGLMGIWPPHQAPVLRLNSKNPHLRTHNGAMIRLRAAREAERFRGPQADGGWADEIDSWDPLRMPATEAFALFEMGIRLGDDPRIVATGTPKRGRLIKELSNRSDVIVTFGRTIDNADNLAPRFLESMFSKYGGTSLGRQELNGELLEEIDGALITYGMIENNRGVLITNGGGTFDTGVDQLEGASATQGSVLSIIEHTLASVDSDYANGGGLGTPEYDAQLQSTQRDVDGTVHGESSLSGVGGGEQGQRTPREVDYIASENQDDLWFAHANQESTPRDVDSVCKKNSRCALPDISNFSPFSVDTQYSVKLEDLDRVCVGVDPSGSLGGDMKGITVGGRRGRHAYLLADLSTHRGPDGWGKIAVNAYYEFKADTIVAEKNYGGDMVRNVIENAAKDLGVSAPPVDLVPATRGKHVRAQPAALLYEQGRVHHCGVFKELEDQMTGYTNVGYEGSDSPDRSDAFIWCLYDLLIKQKWGWSDLYPSKENQTQKLRA